MSQEIRPAAHELSVTDELSVADELFKAYETREPIEPPRMTIPGLDVSGAYRIQSVQEQAFIATGHNVVGRKIGLTSLAMQKQLGVDSPDFGFFTDQMVFVDGDTIEVSRFIAPKIEPELGFRLAADLPVDADFETVASAIEGVYLAAEVIDSRVRDWDIRLVDTIADNASCGAVVVAQRPVSVAVADLPKVTALMAINDVAKGEGSGEAVMGHPLNPLVWLVRTLAEQGVTLKRGDLVLTGSFCGAAPVTAGDTVTVDYGPLGTLTATFQ